MSPSSIGTEGDLLWCTFSHAHWFGESDVHPQSIRVYTKNTTVVSRGTLHGPFCRFRECHLLFFFWANYDCICCHFKALSSIIVLLPLSPLTEGWRRFFPTKQRIHFIETKNPATVSGDVPGSFSLLFCSVFVNTLPTTTYKFCTGFLVRQRSARNHSEERWLYKKYTCCTP